MNQHRPNLSWRKSRLVARLLWRQEHGRLSRRDVQVARRLAEDTAVSPRLVQQALNAFHARQSQLEHARRS